CRQACIGQMHQNAALPGCKCKGRQRRTPATFADLRCRDVIARRLCRVDERYKPAKVRGRADTVKIMGTAKGGALGSVHQAPQEPRLTARRLLMVELNQ